MSTNLSKSLGKRRIYKSVYYVNKLHKALSVVSDSVVKIEIKKKEGTGFLMKSDIGNGEKVYLCVSSDIISKEVVENKEEILIEMNGYHKGELFKVKLDINEIDIKIYPPPNNITYIQITRNVPYLLPDVDTINDEFDLYKLYGEFILIMGTKGKNLKLANGFIEDVNINNIYYKLPLDSDTCGAPIVLINSCKVIAIHKGINKNGKRYGTFIKALKPIIIESKSEPKLKVIKNEIKPVIFQQKAEVKQNIEKKIEIKKAELPKKVEKKSNYGTIYYKKDDILGRYKYTGYLINDIPNGKGTMIYKNGDKSEGNWVNEKREGHGIIEYANGDKFDGNFINDKKEGKGMCQYSDGSKYEGEYKNDKINGQGIFNYTGGEKYEGEFVDDCRCGKGIYYFSDGSKYEGEFKNDQREGHGVCYFSQGDKYDGNWVNDKCEGKGLYLYKNGDKYVGCFKNGLKNGHGICSYTNGSKYDGEWKNDCKDGKGIFYFSSGAKYNGQYKNDIKEGFATYYYADGSYQVGVFSDGKPKGTFKSYSKNGDFIDNVTY